MVHKALSAILLALITVALFLFFKTGAYKSVNVSKSIPPSLQLFYKKHVGPYHEVSDTIKQVEDFFKKLKTPCSLTFGLYLSDPKTVDHSKLVSHVGCAFPAATSPQVFQLPEDFHEEVFSLKAPCLKGSFTGSPSLTAMKVYPKLQEQATKENIDLKNAVAFELYLMDKTNTLTTEVYLCPK